MNVADTKSDKSDSESSTSKISALNDQPSEEDYLGFDEYVGVIKEFLIKSEESFPLTMSVEGEWGTGKSSFMKQLNEELAESDETTVQFNPWRYENKEALWASFAQVFVSEVRSSKSRKNRLCGDIKLLSNRFVRDAKKTKLIRSILTLFVVLALAIVSILVLISSYPIPIPIDLGQRTRLVEILVGSSGIIAALLGGLTVIDQVRSQLLNPLHPNLQEYATNPEYEDRSTFLNEFHDDFDRILDSYIGDDSVYVFIDDLDRCKVSKAAQLMQSINLMLTDDTRIAFVIALDREKTAAGLAAQYEELLPYLNREDTPIAGENASKEDKDAYHRGIRFGHQYLEKFIQIPVIVPSAQTNNIKHLINKEQEPNRGTNRNKIEEDLLKYHSEVLDEVIDMVAPCLNHNPRRIIRFINLYRLRSLLAYEMGMVQFSDGEYTNDSLTLQQLGKFVAISLHSPRLLTQLDSYPDGLANLEKHALGNYNEQDIKKEIQPWTQNDELTTLLRYGCSDDRSMPKYSVRDVDVEKLLWVSPRTDQPTKTEDQDTLTDEEKVSELEGLYSKLNENGFKWLSENDFESSIDHTQWGNGPFSFAEIASGITLDRPYIDDNSSEPKRKGQLFNTLLNGDSVILSGRSGSGKSTTCRFLAYEWYTSNETGDVLYRKENNIENITSNKINILNESISRAKEQDSSPMLIVIEDPFQTHISGISELISSYSTDTDVCFLLEGTEGKYEKVTENDEANDLPDLLTEWIGTQSNLTEYSMPDPSIDEIMEIVNHLEKVTDEDQWITLDQVRTAFKIEEELKENPSLKDHLNSLGLIDGNKNQYSTIEDNLHEKLDIKREMGDIKGVAELLNKLGHICRSTGRLEEALSFYRKSRECHIKNENHIGEVNTLHNIGLVYEKIEDLEKSHASYNKALGICEEFDLEERRIDLLMRMVVLYVRKNDINEAIQWCDYGSSLAEKSSLDLNKEEVWFTSRKAKLKKQLGT
ncbi:P-loop NTPase fold protein [Natrinema versiforme]|uniref:P-loop NTPase fold protein n=1 Tax=Natrinema versiforme TaxID=88724 RepID=UPI000A5B7740|nr:P-loop NTPase fold protein [Natrinema versiforme]